jgi:hypothetical protein
VPDRAQPSAVSLEGEVVQIFETGGVSSFRLVLHHLSMFDLGSGLVADLHLGDRIAIDGVLRVDAVRSLPDVDCVARPPSPGLPTDH